MTGESGAVVTGRLALAVSLPGLHASCFSREPLCSADLRGLFFQPSVKEASATP